MASYQKRGKTWQYTINNKGNPIRKGGFKTKREAMAEATEIENQLNKGIIPHLQLEPFDEYYEKWVETYKQHVGKNTLFRYEATLNTIKESFGGKPIQHIKKRDYQLFLNGYGKTRSKDTSNKLNSHIRACITEAIDEGIIKIDFTRGVTTTGYQGKRSEEKHLSYANSQKLLKYLHNNLHRSLNYYLLLLGLTSGMRFSEMVGLQREDFNFFNNTITVNKTWGYTKRMPEGFGKTKNEQSNRVIGMDDKTMGVFKELFKRTPDNIHQLVFYSPSSKYKVISNGASNKLLNNVLKRLDINHISMHGLRHTHASIALYGKASVHYVSERLGHSDIDTTYKNYVHVIEELRKEDEKLVVGMFSL